MSRRNAWLIGFVCIAVTVLFCGGILLRTVVESQESNNQDHKPESENGKTAVTTKADSPSENFTKQEGADKEETDLPEEEKENQGVKKEELRIVGNPELYLYEDMEWDIQILRKYYGQWLTADSLGETIDGRQLYHLLIGDPAAEEKIFINGGIHGREYMTSQLVMKQLTAFLEHMEAGDCYPDEGETPGEVKSYEELLEGKVIHVIPMVNPDGVTISQKGLDGLQKQESREKIMAIAQMDGETAEGNYLKRWKANAAGVDLNRNFDARWEQYADPAGHPSSDHYKGKFPGSEAESEALIELTKREGFARTISYHTQGSVIYWYFGQEGNLYQETLEFGERISKITGYPLDADYQALDPAGYKDWAIASEEIPSLTIEIGRETSPVPREQFEKIWEENRYVWEETLLDVS